MVYTGKRKRNSTSYTNGVTKSRRVKQGPAMPVAIVRTPRVRQRIPQIAAKPEIKSYDIDPTTYPANTTVSITSVFNPVRGTDLNQMTGRIARPVSIYQRGFVSLNQAIDYAVDIGASFTQYVRYILLWDREVQAALPTITAILRTASPLSQLNLDNRDRFTVIADKTWTLGPIVYDDTTSIATAAIANPSYKFKVFKKLNREVVFNAGTSGTITDINTNSLIMVWIGTRGGTDLAAQADISTRVRYIDA